MAQQLRIGPIDDADKPFQTRLQQLIAHRVVLTQIQQKACDSRVVTEPFVTVAVRGPYALELPPTSSTLSPGFTSAASIIRATM
jgi:hypothetical protein